MEIDSIKSAYRYALPSTAFQPKGLSAVSEEPKISALEQEKIAEKERVRKTREAAERGRDVLFIGNLGEVVSEARHEVLAAGLPPEKWSSLMYGLWPDGGLKNGKE